jgi:hypothetical protein|nr:MAG TPA: Minor structural protein [Bacteriophage sp.]
MKILDTAMTEIVKGNSARYYSKYVVDGKEHTETLNNFKFQNIINPNNEITIGNTCSSGVTFSIYMPTVSLENKEITIFEGVKVGKEINYIKLGIFTVTRQTSDGEYTNYEAYDRMYKADMPYFSDMAFPSTDKAILNEICGKLGISLATNIVTAHTISDKPQGYTYREIIGYMAMLQGCNAIINSDGNLELRWYKDSGYVLDGHKYYQQSVTFTTSKDFIIQKLTCNNTKSGSTEQSQITSGDGATGLSFANPFMTQTILDEVYKKMGGFTFRPLTVKFVGDYRLEVGDIITVNKGGVDYKVPIMQITHECDGGLMDTVTSIGQSDTENTSVASGPITKQMERYYADLILVNKALINKLSVDEADIRYASIETLKAVNANIDNLKTNKLDATYADIINANVENLKAANAEITQLKANSLTADIANLKYAQIDFANVKGQVVTTSLIKDGAVTNEKVQSLSANKLTAGTIDASKITVTNLNADNITVGTINGKRIGTGSLSLDKLAEEVPTKEYLDKVQEDLQGQIDGNIETFTKTEIPTLNNEPAVNWTDDATRKKHIGDICYVVNPTSSADGYSYRFANTGTEQTPVYEWVLIKDSDVTKALQDIININGEITGIKKFNVEISSWKTDTDSELSSLKTRTATLETDMGNKVDTKTFNEVKQTVDENSSTITKMSETLSKKADSSTVTALSNTVNSIKQTTDTNTSSISSMQTTIKNKADSSTVTALSNKASELEQSLNGFKTTVSDTYATKTDLNIVDGKFANYSTTAQMNSAITQSANKITSSVSATYTTKTELNNLQIGGVNRFIKSTVTPNKYITATGIITDGGNYWDLTDYIDVSKWTNYVASGWTNLGNAPATCFFDSNKKFISGVADKSTGVRGSLPVPSNATYMRFSFAHVDTDKLKIEKGTKATDYSPAPEDVNAKFNNYATTASLDLYIKKDPTTGELKSSIEAIADNIILNAKGGLSISGGSSLNITSTGKFELVSNTETYLSPSYNEMNIIKKAILNQTTDTLNKELYDFNSDGVIDVLDMVQAKRYMLGYDTGGTFEEWKYAKKSKVTFEIKPQNAQKCILLSGTDMWGTLRETYIGIDTVKTVGINALQAMLKNLTVVEDESGSLFSPRNDYAANISSLHVGNFHTDYIETGSIKVTNVMEMSSEGTTIKIQNPSDISVTHYGKVKHPAMYTDNPITFGWTGSALNIYVDNIVVATWEWGEAKWY